MKTAIVFQGGGALGAFGAGAWAELAQRVEASSIVAIAGASIGAINAAIVARPAPMGVGQQDILIELWRKEFATPAVPFFGGLTLPVPPSAGSSLDWNGFLTGLLVGIRGFSAAAWPNWNPTAGLGRLTAPLHNRGALWAMLERFAPRYITRSSDAPLLAVAAVNVMEGTLRLFDSDTEVGLREVAASSALPIVFEPVTIEGEMYWDGEVARDSLLPLLHQRLLQTGRLRSNETVQLITIESMPRRIAAMPVAGAEIIYRALTLTQADKYAMEDRAHCDLVRIQREPLPEDGVSGQFDYSPQRIEKLIQQGRDAVTRTFSEAHFA